MKRFLCVLLTSLLLTVSVAAIAAPSDYADPALWVYFEDDVTDKPCDVFLIAPTATTGNAENTYWRDFSDETYYAKFVGAVAMQRGLYEEEARVFSPLYHEAFLTGYTDVEEAERAHILDAAYSDISDAFRYYLENVNNGRPILLAGFSQGSEMCIRLLKEYFADEELASRLVACYAIGWRVTQEDVDAYPQLHVAQGETDTGVIIVFSTEADFIDGSLIIPEGVHTFAVNPLNWKTDATPADRSLNKGACFIDTDGSVLAEIPELTGAYIDPERGALKVTDVTPEEYPPRLKGFADGVYHCYDYQFFYNNLRENVAKRVEAYLAN